MSTLTRQLPYEERRSDSFTASASNRRSSPAWLLEQIEKLPIPL
ncbi:MAG TPA: hypothetical protein VEH79_00345 [Gaiellaceae bacterium]|nr:hypothetical protein [Gaiellaceae bacterium]